MTVYACPTCHGVLQPYLRGMEGSTFTGYQCDGCGYKSAFPEDQNWTYREMECVICSHEWVAVYEEITPTLECPSCSYMNNAPRVNVA